MHLAHLLLAVLLLLIPLAHCSSVEAPPLFIGRPTRVHPAQQQRNRIKAAEKARVAAIIAKRQTSRQKLLAKEEGEEAVSLTRRACTAIHYGPKTSSRVYPTCRNSLWTGYARYTGWDLSGDNLPNQPVYVSYNSGEKGCVAACNSYRTNGDYTCVGVSSDPPDGLCSTDNPLLPLFPLLGICNIPCYLKNRYLCAGQWQQKEGSVVNIKGGCAAWQGLVPANVDAACCNN